MCVMLQVGFDDKRTSLSTSTKDWAPLRHFSVTDGTGAPNMSATPPTPLQTEMACIPTCITGNSLCTISDGVVIVMG